MPRFIEGQDRHQVTLLPEPLDEFIAADTRRLPNVRTEISLHVLAYNFKRSISILGFAKTMKAVVATAT